MTALRSRSGRKHHAGTLELGEVAQIVSPTHLDDVLRSWECNRAERRADVLGR